MWLRRSRSGLACHARRVGVMRPSRGCRTTRRRPQIPAGDAVSPCGIARRPRATHCARSLWWSTAPMFQPPSPSSGAACMRGGRRPVGGRPRRRRRLHPPPWVPASMAGAYSLAPIWAHSATVHPVRASFPEGTGCRDAVSGPRGAGAASRRGLLNGRYGGPIRDAPAWVHEHAAATGWRPVQQLAPPRAAGAWSVPDLATVFQLSSNVGTAAL